MKLVEFLNEMSACAFRLSRSTFDLSTSSELQKMGKRLKQQSEDCAGDIAVKQHKEPNQEK